MENGGRGLVGKGATGNGEAGRRAEASGSGRWEKAELRPERSSGGRGAELAGERGSEQRRVRVALARRGTSDARSRHAGGGDG